MVWLAENNRSLYLSFVFSSNLIVVCNAVVTLAENVIATTAKRSRARLWAPTGLRHLGKFLRESRRSVQDAVGEDGQPEETVESEDRKMFSEWYAAHAHRAHADVSSSRAGS